MDRRYVVPAVVGVVALLATVFLAGALDPLVTTDGYQPDAGAETATPLSYEQTNVTVLDDGTGESLGTVRVAVADTWRKKYTGLSETESLPEDRGMLFPYDSEGEHTYVMRGMSFGIDIIYIGANDTITTIHHAREPPEGTDGEEFEYPGTGKYVLEVPYNWTVRHNVTEGDRVRIEEWS